VTVVLRSGLLAGMGVRHGFNLRAGGVSAGPFESWNLGRNVGDDPGCVDENHARFARVVGYRPGSLYEVDQCHGNSVRVVGANEQPNAVRRSMADALIGRGSGTAIGVRIADCVPVLLADMRAGTVAVIHAGWRGLCAGVIEAAWSALGASAGGAEAGVIAAIFPHIGRCCFEVGEEVAEALRAVSSDAAVIDRTRHRPHVDLGAIVRAKLVRLGLRSECVDEVPGCTRCDAERFFSFRRQGQRSGRHVAAIVAP
jgi:YfiH family protein